LLGGLYRDFEEGNRLRKEIGLRWIVRWRCGIVQWPYDLRRFVDISDSKVYWSMVTISDPLEQVPDEVMEAVTEVVPVEIKVAKPEVEENAIIEVSPDVQVALLVTLLLLLSVAVN
jgi:hypothetical protein